MRYGWPAPFLGLGPGAPSHGSRIWSGMKTQDLLVYVTRVEQIDAPTEDLTGDPVLPPVSGGEVLVTAEAADAGLVQFAASVEDRVAVGDRVHLRIDHAPPGSD
jgi:hypothetical protein